MARAHMIHRLYSKYIFIGSNNIMQQNDLILGIQRCNIGIKHGFPCINICQVPREVLKTEVEDRGF